MRSQNVGIVGLALVGVVAFAPQQALANAYYYVDVDTTTDAYLYHSDESPVTSGSISVVNLFPGVKSTSGGYYVDAAGGVSTFTNSGSASGPGTSVSATHDLLLEGVATGAGAQARAWYNYNERTNLQTISNTTTLGTLVTITGLTETTDLSLLMTLDYLLATADSGGGNTWAETYWTVTYSTKASGSSTWGNWTPSCAAGYFCGATPFGDGNTGYDSTAYSSGAPAGYQIVSGSGDYDITTSLAAGTDYRFRLALSVRGIADSVNAGASPTPPIPGAVPLPAALPMLGAAMAGLGLLAARRRKS